MRPYEKENNDGERKQPMKKVISLMLALVLALILPLTYWTNRRK